MKNLKDTVIARFSKPYKIIGSVAKTETAAHKDENEDSVVSWNDQKCGVFCVADGIGGAPGGQQASGQIVDLIDNQCKCVARDKDYENFRDAIAAAISEVNTRIYDNDIEGMGATVVALSMETTLGITQIMHAGDSRLYRFRNRSLKRLTKDHSVAVQMGYSDDDAVPHIIRGRITNAVGIRKELKLKKSWLNVRDDDIYLLCSDGLNKHLKDDEIAEILRETVVAGVDNTAKSLLEVTRKRGATDDVSVVLVQVASESAKKSLFTRASLVSMSIFLFLLVLGIFYGTKAVRDRRARVAQERVSPEISASPLNTSLEALISDSDDEQAISVAEVFKILPRSNVARKERKSEIEDSIEMNHAGNWKVFGNGLLDSNIDIEGREVELDVSWVASRWGVGVMFTADTAVNARYQLTVSAEIRSEFGSQTRVYAGVSTLDDANLESERGMAQAVTRDWQKFTFPVSEMKASRPDWTSRNFRETDLTRIQTYKLLFTKPNDGSKYDKILIRNPGISPSVTPQGDGVME